MKRLSQFLSGVIRTSVRTVVYKTFQLVLVVSTRVLLSTRACMLWGSFMNTPGWIETNMSKSTGIILKQVDLSYSSGELF